MKHTVCRTIEEVEIGFGLWMTADVEVEVDVTTYPEGFEYEMRETPIITDIEIQNGSGDPLDNEIVYPNCKSDTGIEKMLEERIIALFKTAVSYGEWDTAVSMEIDEMLEERDMAAEDAAWDNKFQESRGC